MKELFLCRQYSYESNILVKAISLCGQYSYEGIILMQAISLWRGSLSSFNQIILAWQKVFMRLKRQMCLMFIKTLKIQKYNANILIFVRKWVIIGVDDISGKNYQQSIYQPLWNYRYWYRKYQYLSWNTADKYKYQRMKIRVCWVGQSTRGGWYEQLADIFWSVSGWGIQWIHILVFWDVLSLWLASYILPTLSVLSHKKGCHFFNFTKLQWGWWAMAGGSQRIKHSTLTKTNTCFSLLWFMASQYMYLIAR